MSSLLSPTVTAPCPGQVWRDSLQRFGMHHAKFREWNRMWGDKQAATCSGRTQVEGSAASMKCGTCGYKARFIRCQSCQNISVVRGRTSMLICTYCSNQETPSTFLWIGGWKPPIAVTAGEWVATLQRIESRVGATGGWIGGGFEIIGGSKATRLGERVGLTVGTAGAWLTTASSDDVHLERESITKIDFSGAGASATDGGFFGVGAGMVVASVLNAATTEHHMDAQVFIGCADGELILASFQHDPTELRVGMSTIIPEARAA